MGGGKIPHPSAHGVGGITDPEVLRVEELLLPLIRCSTQENRPCILPRQYSKTDPIGGGVGGPAITCAWESCPHYFLSCGGVEDEEVPPDS